MFNLRSTLHRNIITTKIALKTNSSSPLYHPVYPTHRTHDQGSGEDWMTAYHTLIKSNKEIVVSETLGNKITYKPITLKWGGKLRSLTEYSNHTDIAFPSFVWLTVAVSLSNCLVMIFCMSSVAIYTRRRWICYIKCNLPSLCYWIQSSAVWLPDTSNCV